MSNFGSLPIPGRLGVFPCYRYYDSLPSPLVSKLLDSVLSGLLASVEAISRELDSERGGQEMDSGLRVPLEMYAFLLQWFAAAAERHSPQADGDPVATASKSKVSKAFSLKDQTCSVHLL